MHGNDGPHQQCAERPDGKPAARAVDVQAAAQERWLSRALSLSLSLRRKTCLACCTRRDTSDACLYGVDAPRDVIAAARAAGSPAGRSVSVIASDAAAHDGLRRLATALSTQTWPLVAANYRRSRRRRAVPSRPGRPRRAPESRTPPSPRRRPRRESLRCTARKAAATHGAGLQRQPQQPQQPQQHPHGARLASATRSHLLL